MNKCPPKKDCCLYWQNATGLLYIDFPPQSTDVEMGFINQYAVSRLNPHI